MTTYRWTQHRVFNSAGNDKLGNAAISLWWIARAAAEETLQGLPLAASWLKLFRTQLSIVDPYWLRWRGDMAESAELRRAYSGLYGRFVARALLSNHLGLTRFLSLKRNGITVPGSVEVRRTAKGDIPDWLAWDEQNSRLVLGEAKGSLSSNDFLVAGGPKCVRDGKAQFDRVETYHGTSVVQPARWVAATRWATDQRNCDPVTILWDPPVDGTPFGEEEARRHRTAMTRSWLSSIALGMGWSDADDLLSEERAREALVIKAEPGPIREEEDWPELDLIEEIIPQVRVERIPTPSLERTELDLAAAILRDDLMKSEVYPDRSILVPRDREVAAYENAYIAAVVTRFGVRPVRSQNEFEMLQRDQERARRLEEPAMLVGVPLGINPAERKTGDTWLDGAGIAPPEDLAVFDLRHVSAEPLEPLKLG